LIFAVPPLNLFVFSLQHFTLENLCSLWFGEPGDLEDVRCVHIVVAIRLTGIRRLPYASHDRDVLDKHLIDGDSGVDGRVDRRGHRELLLLRKGLKICDLQISASIFSARFASADSILAYVSEEKCLMSDKWKLLRNWIRRDQLVEEQSTSFDVFPDGLPGGISLPTFETPTFSSSQHKYLLVTNK
jgi:hypothetical protein